MATKEFEFLMAFKKYRNLRKRLDQVNKDNRVLRQNWKQQIIINDNLKDKLKEKNRIIYKLRKKDKDEQERNYKEMRTNVRKSKS